MQPDTEEALQVEETAQSHPDSDSNHRFSDRAIRSFASSVFNKLGKGLLAVANLEEEEADEEYQEPDPLEESRNQREEQLKTWRSSHHAFIRQRAERQMHYKTLCFAALERTAKTVEELNLPEEPETPQDITRIETPVMLEPAPIPQQVNEEKPVCLEAYQLPPNSLLQQPEHQQVIFIEPEELEQQKATIQDTLDSFAVDATVWDAIVGPRITQLRIKPGLGVRVESINALRNNFALALAAESVRIQAPIPGKPYVGIEIPNGNSAPLSLSLMFQSIAWCESEAHIPILLGMELGGDICIADLAAAPHMLIAGATGSGKSVCMNTLIMSLLKRFSPDDLELVLIDPKQVEFGAYHSLPHLVRPVITDPKLVVPALQWVVREMEERYKTMSTVAARNIAGYNEKMRDLGLKTMPFMVVIIDELADIMMTSGADVETSLARIAQLSRAVGIHMIIATQRPSVNVLTGTIKANFPTRVAFKVSSQFDSRTILDGKGAESLRGQGDMLFSPPGIGLLRRVQGPLVHDGEINAFVEFCTEQREQHFRTSAVNLEPVDSEPLSGLGGSAAGDPLLEEAISIILRSQRASTSYLQRCLRIGYNRAANLIEEMEERGIVGPQIGSTPREILIDSYNGSEGDHG